MPERAFEPIHANWNPCAEAFFFWRLMWMNKETLECAQADILMTEKQLAWLIREYPLEATIIKDIYEQRKETWKAFQFLCAHPEAAPEFQRAALSQSRS